MDKARQVMETSNIAQKTVEFIAHKIHECSLTDTVTPQREWKQPLQFQTPII